MLTVTKQACDFDQAISKPVAPAIASILIRWWLEPSRDQHLPTDWSPLPQVKADGLVLLSRTSLFKRETVNADSKASYQLDESYRVFENIPNSIWYWKKARMKCSPKLCVHFKFSHSELCCQMLACQVCCHNAGEGLQDLVFSRGDRYYILFNNRGKNKNWWVEAPLVVPSWRCGNIPQWVD